MKTKVNFNAESLDSFGVVELNSTQAGEVDGGFLPLLFFGGALFLAGCSCSVTINNYGNTAAGAQFNIHYRSDSTRNGY